MEAKHMGVVSFEDLKTVTGYDQPAHVAACLSKQGVPFFHGKKGRIWTTMGALDTVLGVNGPVRNSDNVKESVIEI